MKGTTFFVAVRHFPISPEQESRIVCEANAVWQAPTAPRNEAPSIDWLSAMTLRDGSATRMLGDMRHYSTVDLALKADVERLAGLR